MCLAKVELAIHYQWYQRIQQHQRLPGSYTAIVYFVIMIMRRIKICNTLYRRHSLSLSLTPNGNVRYQLKTPYRDGTAHVIFEPLDFIA